MLLQKARIGKTAVLIIILILSLLFAALPLLLRASATGDAESTLFLPIIYNEDHLTPDPGTESTPPPTSSHTPTATSTATNTATPAPECDLRFAKEAFGNSPYVLVTGDVGIEVTITNLTTDAVIGNGILNGPVAGQDCPGFSYITVTPRLDETHVGHTLRVYQTDNPANADTTIVLETNPQPTSTPNAPYLAVTPNCGIGPDVQFKVEGNNWPIDQSLTLFWEGVPQVVFQANQHTGFFIMTWTFAGLSDGTYSISALSGTNGVSDSVAFYVSCDLVPTSTPSPTDIPASDPADLIVGPPQLISTPPIIVYQPLAFEVPITNTGDIDINTLFFVDLLFDPPPAHIEDSYTAVSGLSGGSTVTLTITSTIGLANFIGNHQVTALVDSLDHVVETDETNNLSAPFEITISEPAMTPNYTPTPTGGSTVSGVARVMVGGTFHSQERMHLSAIEEATGEVVAVTYSDENGFYQFDNLIAGTSYTVQGCIMIDNNAYFGVRTNRTPPDAFADIFAVQSTSCP